MAPWLTYGTDEAGKLISIELVERGRTALHCPYCNGLLTAKKGRKMAHHFAHTEESCQDMRRKAAELPTLPCYDRFDLLLSPRDFAELKSLWTRSSQGEWGVTTGRKRVRERLVSKGLLRWNNYRGRRRLGGYEFTKLGKIPFGGLSLQLFTEEQSLLISQRLIEFERRIARGLGQGEQVGYQRCDVSIRQPLADLRLYRSQLRRVLSLSLYYLKVEADGQTLYKVGVTSRDVGNRIKEVRQDLAKHFSAVEVDLINCWPHYGSCELYFKHRYKAFNYPIGPLTEYFLFPDDETVEATIEDLRRLRPRTLDGMEQAVVAEEPSYIEQRVADNVEAYERYERAHTIKQGMQRAARQGKDIGRKTGKETAAQFLAKPKSRAISAALREGDSLRQTAQKTGAAVNTVRKVKRLLAAVEGS